MKIMTCREIGGPCDEGITGESFDDIAAKGYQHIADIQDDEHKKVKEHIDSASDEDKKIWMEETAPKFNSAPEA
jgi:hypothetical protein